MPNNLAVTTCNFIKKKWKLTQLLGLTVEFLILTTAIWALHCYTQFFQSTLHVRHFIVNENYGTFDWRHYLPLRPLDSSLAMAGYRRAVCAVVRWLIGVYHVRVLCRNGYKYDRSCFNCLQCDFCPTAVWEFVSREEKGLGLHRCIQGRKGAFPYPCGEFTNVYIKQGHVVVVVVIA